MKNAGRISLLFIGDIAILIASFWITLYLGFYNALNQNIIESHIIPFTILYTLWVLIIFLFNLYELKLSKPTLPNLQTIGHALITCFFIGVIFFYSLPIFSIAPKINLIINIISFGFLFLVWRRVFFLIFAKNFHKQICVIAPRTNTSAQELSEFIQKNPQAGYLFVKYFEHPTHFLTSNQVCETVVVAKEFLNNPEYFTKLYKSNIQIVELSYAYEELLAKIPVELIDESWFIHKLSTQESTLYRYTKRVIDIVASIIGIIVCIPILVVAGIAIKIEDGGSIFYTQKRNGKNNITFKIIKLRTMISNSETSGAVWALKNDSRITKVGAILRKTHIDELPQLFNILRGDISLVGPRPERPEFVTELEQQIPFYHLRHTTKPGFTGWAQIKFRYARSVEDSQEKFEYDLYYIKNKNIILDLGIITKTIQIIFTH